MSLDRTWKISTRQRHHFVLHFVCENLHSGNVQSKYSICRLSPKMSWKFIAPESLALQRHSIVDITVYVSRATRFVHPGWYNRISTFQNMNSVMPESTSFKKYHSDFVIMSELKCMTSESCSKLDRAKEYT